MLDYLDDADIEIELIEGEPGRAGGGAARPRPEAGETAVWLADPDGEPGTGPRAGRAADRRRGRGAGAAPGQLRPARGEADGRGRGDGPAALARRLPLGRPADPPDAGEVPARRGLRDRGDDRGRRVGRAGRGPGRAARGARRRAAPGGLPLPDRPGAPGRPLRHRRRGRGDRPEADRPSPARLRRRRRSPGHRPPPDVEANWEQITAAEKGRTSAVEGVPLAQPALSLADKLLKRSRNAGLEVTVPRSTGGIVGDRHRSGTGSDGCCWPWSRTPGRSGVDPEEALRTASRALRDEIVAVEGSQQAAAAG